MIASTTREFESVVWRVYFFHQKADIWVCVAVLEQPISRRPQKRDRTSRTFVPHFSNYKDDQDKIAVERSSDFRRVLKEVVIPSISARKASARGRPSTLEAQPK
jgi:hypothetical protein